MSQQTNLFQDLPVSIPAEVVEVLAKGPDTRIEKIVSTGHRSPDDFWYDQEEEEWVLVLQGQAELTFEDGETVNLGPGDHLLIPAHRKHRVSWTTPSEPTVWLAVFFKGD